MRQDAHNSGDASAAPCAGLRIGDMAPDFSARSTTGDVRLSDYRGRWLVLFSHPADFT
ncbi:MAG TPA: peroxiredoxin, partial [Erythrobacter sp.]|nr:peroxiredoxin [Erythrobacter sp.]